MTLNPLPLLAAWWHTRAPRGQFWIYFFSAILFNFGFSVFFFLFNLYLLGTGLDERSLGHIGSFMAVGTLCGTIPAGILAQRLGLRWTLTAGIAIAVTASILRVQTVSPPAQFAFAALSGFGLCTWGVCLSPAVAGLTTETQRPSAFSLMFASGIGVAGLGGYAAGNLPALVRLHLQLTLVASERFVLLFACGVAALSLVPIACLTLQSAAPRARSIPVPGTFLRKFLPAIAVWSLVTGAFPPFANVFFVHYLGLSLQSMGSVVSLSQLVQFATILLAPLLFRRFGLTTGVVLTQLTTAILLLCLARIGNATHAAWLYWAYMSSQCMNEPGIYSLLMDRIPADERNGASSYTFFISAASAIVASTAVGSSIVRFGYPAVLCSIAGLAVCAALLFARLASTATPNFLPRSLPASETCLCRPNVSSLSRKPFLSDPGL